MRDKIADIKHLLYGYHDRLVEYLVGCVDAVAPWGHGESVGRVPATIGLLLVAAFVPFLIVAAVSWWLGAFWRTVIMGRKK